MDEAPIAAGPLERHVREPDDGFCQVCMVHRPSLPPPAAGTCAYCFNHLLKPCHECAHYYSGQIGGLQVGMSQCRGSPDKRQFDWRYARRSDAKCGAEAKWGKFPNSVLDRNIE